MAQQEVGNVGVLDMSLVELGPVAGWAVSHAA